jgi:hypothetical protein
MDNQHEKIKGYRDLTENEILQMNNCKEQGSILDVLIGSLRNGAKDGIDQRWVSIGQTHLQQGIMALVRSIARPES